MMVGSEKNSSTVRVGWAFVEQKVEILLTFTSWTKQSKHGSWESQLFVFSQTAFWSNLRSPLTQSSTVQDWGGYISGILQCQRPIEMHATTEPNMQTRLMWELLRSKPGLWSWHLIPTSCRLSEQLQGRILQLSCKWSGWNKTVLLRKSKTSDRTEQEHNLKFVFMSTR